MNRTMIVVVAVGLALYVLFSSVYVVNEREQAIVTRFGEIARVETEPGLFFKVPTDIMENVQIIEDRILRYELDDITVQVSGGKFYEVDAFLTYKIVNPQLFRERVFGNRNEAESRINTRLNSALRQVYGLRDFNAALSAQRTEMMLEARNLISAGIADLGIEVVDVRVLRTDLTSQVSQQTYERMKAERLAEAALLRARGREQAQSLRATADRQVVEILALANRDSEILRGEGEARRNAVFADAFERDIEFFEFYRTMQSYREALLEDGTSLILSPDSEFFNYFLSDQVLPVEPIQPASAPSAVAQ
ncbi:MAG: protease modulator HflC [Alphaproteobacteria bacterium]|nr:protease modulator HflC [Alphaproteobacteria bacterium]